MRTFYFLLGLLAFLSPFTAAWSKEDREIFRIKDEISAHEVDPAATFYDILGVAPSASLDDINKAFRKLTRSLHPDKVKQQLKADRAKAAKSDKSNKKAAAKPPTQREVKAAVKEASERQARLSLIATILRGEGRDRYDHYLANGFPLWKGTDYYYNRYRPGFGTVMVGLLLFGGGGIHYLILYMSWKRQKEFVERYIKFARKAAWGEDVGGGIPGVDEAPPTPAPVPSPEEEEGPPMQMNRKQRRMQEKESKKEEGRGRASKIKKEATKSASVSRETSTGPVGPKKRVVAENGKILVVDSQGDVYLEQQDEEGNVDEFLLDPNELAQPTFKDTAVVRVPLWAYEAIMSRVSPGTTKAAVEAGEATAAGGDDSDRPQLTPTTDSEEFELLEKSTDSLGKAKSSGVQAGGKPSKRRGGKKK